MRIVVFSDSHRNKAVLEHIMRTHPEADVLLHLGDGEREFDELRKKYPEKRMIGVVGNCDLGSAGNVIGVLRAGTKKVFFAHGHTFGVKAGTDEFVRAARNLKADVALYGHTHVAYKGYEDGLYVMNPGSVAFPNQGPPSYGIVDITPAGIALSVARLERRERRR